MNKYIIGIVVIGVAYYFYSMSNSTAPQGTRQCCDINFTNYNADCDPINGGSVDCICDNSKCANTGSSLKITNNN